MVAELDMIRYCVEVSTRFQRGANSPFRPASDEKAEREVVFQDTVPNGSQQLCLSIFSLASLINVEVGRVWIVI